MTANNRNNRDHDPKVPAGSGFGGQHDRDRWTNSPDGKAQQNYGGAGGGEFEQDRDTGTADGEETESVAQRDTTTADEITGPDAGDERYGAARDREREGTGNIGDR